MRKLIAVLFAVNIAVITYATPVINPDGIILPRNAQTGTAYTLLITDKSGTEITMNNAASNVLTIPANATAAFPIGAAYTVQQIGAGATTITAAAGVTLNGSVASSVVMPLQYGSIVLRKLAEDTWTATLFTSDGDMTKAVFDPATIAEQLVGLTATQTLTDKTLTSPVLNTGVSGTAVLDEDDLTSDSDTQIATQQSIKAYVDSAIAVSVKDISAKTADYTVVATDYAILADGTSNTVAITLPASPTQGQIFVIKAINIDNAVTVARNGNTINGAASDLTPTLDLVYYLQFDATYGWVTL